MFRLAPFRHLTFSLAIFFIAVLLQTSVGSEDSSGGAPPTTLPASSVKQPIQDLERAAPKAAEVVKLARAECIDRFMRTERYRRLKDAVDAAQAANDASRLREDLQERTKAASSLLLAKKALADAELEVTAADKALALANADLLEAQKRLRDRLESDRLEQTAKDERRLQESAVEIATRTARTIDLAKLGAKAGSIIEAINYASRANDLKDSEMTAALTRLKGIQDEMKQIEAAIGTVEVTRDLNAAVEAALSDPTPRRKLAQVQAMWNGERSHLLDLLWDCRRHADHDQQIEIQRILQQLRPAE